MDKVFIKNLEVEAIIGIFQWEREVRQLISVDIEMDFHNKTFLSEQLTGVCNSHVFIEIL